MTLAQRGTTGTPSEGLENVFVVIALAGTVLACAIFAWWWWKFRRGA